MLFDNFIRSNYKTACELQRGIPKDNEMIFMLANGDENVQLVKAWMKDYGLFQGITSSDRERIARRFLVFSQSNRQRPALQESNALREIYSELFWALFGEVARSWMSATSKLLWCMYPDRIIIFDSFVWRAVVVMQCFDDHLSKQPRLGVAPSVNIQSEIETATDFYMRYQEMVKYLYESHRTTLDEMRNLYREPYTYDIRIVDKLLWMIGNPNQHISNGQQAQR